MLCGWGLTNGWEVCLYDFRLSQLFYTLPPARFSFVLQALSHAHTEERGHIAGHQMLLETVARCNAKMGVLESVAGSRTTHCLVESFLKILAHAWRCGLQTWVINWLHVCLDSSRKLAKGFVAAQSVDNTKALRDIIITIFVQDWTCSKENSETFNWLSLFGMQDVLNASPQYDYTATWGQRRQKFLSWGRCRQISSVAVASKCKEELISKMHCIWSGAYSCLCSAPQQRALLWCLQSAPRVFDFIHCVLSF